MSEMPAADARDAIVGGLSDPDAAAAGMDVRGTLTWGDPEDIPDRNAALPAYYVGVREIRDAEGKHKIVPASDRKSGAEVRPRTSNRSDAWLALALIRKGRHDCRPNLLALVKFGAGNALEQLIDYGACYVKAWAAMAGREYSRNVLQAAAADALHIVVGGETRVRHKRRKDELPWWEREPGKRDAPASRPPSIAKARQTPRVPVAARAKQLGIDNAVFGELRRVAICAYERRLQEAEARVARVSDYTPMRYNIASNSVPRAARWKPNRTTLTLRGAAAAIYHRRNPAEPRTDWMHRGKGLTPANGYNDIEGIENKNGRFMRAA